MTLVPCVVLDNMPAEHARPERTLGMQVRRVEGDNSPHEFHDVEPATGPTAGVRERVRERRGRQAHVAPVRTCGAGHSGALTGALQRRAGRRAVERTRRPACMRRRVVCRE